MEVEAEGVGCWGGCREGVVIVVLVVTHVGTVDSEVDDKENK